MVMETRKVRKIPPLPRRLIQIFHSSRPDLGRWKKNSKLLCDSPNVFLLHNFLSESEIQYFDQIITKHKRLFRSSFTEGADADEVIEEWEEGEEDKEEGVTGGDGAVNDEKCYEMNIDCNDVSTSDTPDTVVTAPSSSSVNGTRTADNQNSTITTAAIVDEVTQDTGDATSSIIQSPSTSSAVIKAPTKKVYSEERTSTYIHLTKSQDNIVRGIERKTADLLGLDVSNVEPLQIVHYENGQQFTVHHDAGTLNAEDGEIVDVIEPRRFVTLFVYLNNLPDNEGCTEFPSLNLKVRPIRGSAVMFCNLLPDGTADKRTIHCANPVSYPLEKYGLNIWVCDQNLHDYTHMPVKIKLNTKRSCPSNGGNNEKEKSTTAMHISTLQQVEAKTDKAIQKLLEGQAADSKEDVITEGSLKGIVVGGESKEIGDQVTSHRGNCLNDDQLYFSRVEPITSRSS